ncbi:MAG: methyl-accepting chemotaxis protein [Fusobacteriota bacterium]
MKLRDKIILPTVGILSTIFIIFIVFLISVQKDQSMNHLEQKIDLISRTIPGISASSIWNLDYDQLEEDMNIFLKNNYITYIKVIDSYDETLTEIGKLEKEENINLIKEVIDIKKEGESIGKAEIHFTNKFAMQEVTKTRNFLIISLAVILIILIITITSISSVLLKPLQKFSKAFKKGTEGDLQIKLDIKTKDEIGNLANQFNEFMEILNGLIKGILEMVDKVEEKNKKLSKTMDNIVLGEDSEYFKDLEDKVEKGIKQLKEYNEEVMDSVRSQTASSEQSLATLQEVSATSKNIGEKTEKTNETSKEALERSKGSVEQIEAMNSKMEETNKNVQRSSKKIGDLSGLSDRIGEIIVAINGISEQTNLLALNAAIEAARAGEAGKGFAVVAEEIRKLAEKTNGETDKIEEIITDIQKEVETVQDANDMVIGNVQAGMDISQSIRKAIDNIMNMIRKNNEEISSITQSMKEEVVATEEITEAIGAITDQSTEIEEKSTYNYEISEKINHILDRQIKEMTNLTSMAGELKEKVKFFKLKEVEAIHSGDLKELNKN